MKWTKEDRGILAAIWIGVMGFITIVLVVIPDPSEPREQARLPSVLLDFLFGAIAVAVAIGIGCVVWTIWFVGKSERETGHKLQALENTLRGEFTEHQRVELDKSRQQDGR